MKFIVSKIAMIPIYKNDLKPASSYKRCARLNTNGLTKSAAAIIPDWVYADDERIQVGDMVTIHEGHAIKECRA